MVGIGNAKKKKKKIEMMKNHEQCGKTVQW